jgi:endosialidase-like protein
MSAQEAAVAVVVDGNGQLGNVSSSRRYKFDIAEMQTDKLMLLRPVTFRSIAHGEHASLQYGLVAEEVVEDYFHLGSCPDTSLQERP